MWHFVFTPFSTTQTSPKSTSASAPGRVFLRDECLHPAAGLDIDLGPADPT